MKRVRYLAGLVGLAPVAVGLLAPAGAHAATATPRLPRTSAKTVRLPDSRVVHPDTGCAGSIYRKIPRNDNISGWFWYAVLPDNYVCIGTVDEKLYLGRSTVQELKINVEACYSGICLYNSEYDYKDVYLRAPSTSYAFGIHGSFLPVQTMEVCLRATNFKGYACQAVFNGN
jgi:hypothetical protein